MPHCLVASFAYELPFGRGKQYGAGMNKVADLLAGGWQTNGILTFAQGQFQMLNLGSDWILVGSLNHTRFGSANLNTQSAAFGAITSTRVTACRMQLGRKAIWWPLPAGDSLVLPPHPLCYLVRLAVPHQLQ